MQRRGLRAAIARRDFDQDFFGRRFSVFDENVEVAIFVENAGINQFVLWNQTRAFAIFVDKLIVRKLGLGIFVEKFQV